MPHARPPGRRYDSTVPLPAQTTRLAPSPTGSLHLGNAFAFAVCWALARQKGWRILLRIEDFGARIQPGADALCLSTLEWLGLDWDAGPLWQTREVAPYREALARLHEKGLVYPCACTRRALEEAMKEAQSDASAPNEGDHEVRYPGTCRGKGISAPLPDFERKLSPQEIKTNLAWRLRVPDGPIAHRDTLRGDLACDVQKQVGDFIVGMKANLPAYQLAVVVDDMRQGVTQVVRGADLLDSTARQMLIYQAFGAAPPAFTHLPLVRGQDGLRLAKRHGDTRLLGYQARGVRQERVLGLLAYWAGAQTARREISAGEFTAVLDLAKMPRDTIVFAPEDDLWLTA